MDAQLAAGANLELELGAPWDEYPYRGNAARGVQRALLRQTPNRPASQFGRFEKGGWRKCSEIGGYASLAG